MSTYFKTKVIEAAFDNITMIQMEDIFYSCITIIEYMCAFSNIMD